MTSKTPIADMVEHMITSDTPTPTIILAIRAAEQHHAEQRLHPGPGDDEVFVKFWAEYPKRDGTNPKAPAYKKFTTAVKNGADPEAIIAGARRYAVQMAEKRKIGTPYVMQAMTWLNQRCWEDYGEPKGMSGSLIELRPIDNEWVAWKFYYQQINATARLAHMLKCELMNDSHPVPSRMPPSVNGNGMA